MIDMIILNFVFIADECHEISYTAPSMAIKHRKRGRTQQTSEDAVISTLIRQGRSHRVLEAARSDRQKDLFRQFQQGIYINIS